MDADVEPRSQIEIRDQKNLGFRGTLRLCLKGVTHRLFRSALTLSVVTLAVAFFMFLLSENALVTAAAGVVGREIAEQRLATRLMTRLGESPVGLALSGLLSRYAGQPDLLAEVSSLSGLDKTWIADVAARARQEQDYLRFFESLPPGKRLLLIQKREGRNIFGHLSEPCAQAVFENQLTLMRELRIPGGLPGFHAFLAQFPSYRAELETLEKRWKSGQRAFGEEALKQTGGAEVEAWLAGATPAQLEAWSLFTRSNGFAVTPGEWTLAQRQVQTARARRLVTEKLDSPEARAEWRRLFRDRKPRATEEKLLMLKDARAGQILGGAVGKDERLAVARDAAKAVRLAGLERKLRARIETDGEKGALLRPRQAFLLLISFLVCAVGVGNAMLMSITERFREIATMKCLGATDGYILLQFMLEATLQGSVGGLLGALIGFAAAVVKQGVLLGGVVFTAWPGSALIGAGLTAAGIGILLSVLASIYPAWAASRMAPMEAMRVE